MQRILLKSKIHRACVTDANLNYEGSITIDEELMEAADIVPFEKVQVWNINNGARFETYAVAGDRGSGQICLNGAASRMVQINDLLIIASFISLDEEEVKTHKPKIVYVDESNHQKKEGMLKLC